MAFPTTGILDDFNRANGPLGANWTALVGGFVVSSNTCAASGAGTDADQWAPSTFGPDVESYYTIATLIPSGAAMVVGIIRNGTFDGYGAVWQANPGNDTFRLQRFDAGGGTDIGTPLGSVNPVAGDAIGYFLHGTAHQFWYRVGGVWSLMDSGTDSTHTGHTDYRLLLSLGTGTSGAFDDFGGGNESVTPPPVDITASVAWVTA